MPWRAIPSKSAGSMPGPKVCAPPVDTENPVRIENTGVRSVHEIIIVSTMSPFFIALLALVASIFSDPCRSAG